MKRLLKIILYSVSICCALQQSHAQVLVTSCNQAVDKLNELSGFHYTLTSSSYRDPNSPWPQTNREPACNELLNGDSGYVQVTVERSVSNSNFALQQSNGTWERGNEFLRRIQNGIENFRPGSRHSILSRIEVCDPNIDWYHHCNGSFSFNANGNWQQYGHYDLESYRAPQNQNRNIIIQSTFYFNIVGGVADTPTPSPSPTPTITSTISVTMTPTPSPTPTPTQCLSEEEVSAQIVDLVSTQEDVCVGEVVERISSSISEVNAKACLQPRPKPDLRKGLFTLIEQGKKLGNPTYQSWPSCPGVIYRSILAGGYPLIGSPAQRNNTIDFLEDNDWDCKFRVKDEIHPYRLGFGSQHKEALVVVPKVLPKGKASGVPEYVLGVTGSNVTIAKNYPQSLIRKNYIRTAKEMYEDLINHRSIPEIGEITQKKYGELLKKIPRDLISFWNFGVIKDKDQVIRADHRYLKLGKTVDRARACFPPKEKIARDEDSCGDYSLEQSCVEELAKSEGLRKGAQEYLSGQQINPFRKKAIAAAYAAGFRNEYLIKMVQITEAETTQNYWVRNPVSPDDSYGLIQYNLRSDSDRKRKIIKRFGSLSALFDPRVSLILGSEMSGGGKLFDKSPSVVRNTWSTFGRSKYNRAKRPVTIAVRDYLEWRRNQNG